MLHEHHDKVHVPALASTRVTELTDAALLQGADPRRSYAVFELVEQGTPVSRHLLYFEPALALQLPDPDLHAELHDSGHGIVLSVRAERLAREVWIDFGSLDAQVSDNAFDLLPGERVELQGYRHGRHRVVAQRHCMCVRCSTPPCASARQPPPEAARP